MTKISAIINPISGGIQKETIVQQIKAALSKNYDLYFFYTEKPSHGVDLAKEALKKGSDIIIAVGGDGSVNEISQCLINSNALLAIIPTGSGNGLARYLKIPLEVSAAISLIQKGEIALIDTVCLNNRFFLGVAGVGFDAEIAWAFSEFGYRGFLSYFLVTLNKFPTYQSTTYYFKIDGKEFEREAFLICFANSSQFGNGAFIAPNARTNDGLIDVVILKKFPFSAATRIAHQLFNRKLHTSKFVEIIQGKEIEMQQPNLKAHIDGEPIFFPNGMHLKIMPSSLKVLVPKVPARII